MGAPFFAPDCKNRPESEYPSGMLPLTGTTDAEHMRLDLDLFDFHLDHAELHTIERLALT